MRKCNLCLAAILICLFLLTSGCSSCSQKNQTDLAFCYPREEAQNALKEHLEFDTGDNPAVSLAQIAFFQPSMPQELSKNGFIAYFQNNEPVYVITMKSFGYFSQTVCPVRRLTQQEILNHKESLIKARQFFEGQLGKSDMILYFSDSFCAALSECLIYLAKDQVKFDTMYYLKFEGADVKLYKAKGKDNKLIAAERFLYEKNQIPLN